MTPAPVTRDTTATLLPPRFRPVKAPWGGLLNPGGDPVQVKMRWSEQDPYAVAFEFRTGPRRWVAWRFDRGLLALASLGPAGEGDVRMELHDNLDDPRASALIVELASPSGHAVFWFYPDSVADFLHATYQVVQLGMEQLPVDWDTELTEVRTPGGGAR